MAASAATVTISSAERRRAVAAGVVGEVANWAASGPDNSAPSTTNCGPGLTNSSC